MDVIAALVDVYRRPICIPLPLVVMDVLPMYLFVAVVAERTSHPLCSKQELPPQKLETELVSPLPLQHIPGSQSPPL